MKREEPRAAATYRLIEGTLKEGRATQIQVRDFLKTNFPSLPVSESPAEITAGPMIFSFDDRGTVIRILQEIPCPIA